MISSMVYKYLIRYWEYIPSQTKVLPGLLATTPAHSSLVQLASQVGHGVRTALSNPKLTNPSGVYGGAGVESGSISAGDWRRLIRRVWQGAEETQQRAGEAEGMQ